jgi:DNA-binding LacI/PurR family transcriptional regulator
MTRERAKRPGTTRSGSVTISDVARMAHVGVATVSRVLNDSPKVSPKTAARVRRVLEQTKYRPAYAARALARGHTNTIELLYNTYAAKLSQDPVLLTILDLAHAELQRSGYRLVFSAINTEFAEVPSSRRVGAAARATLGPAGCPRQGNGFERDQRPLPRHVRGG